MVITFLRVLLTASTTSLVIVINSCLNSCGATGRRISDQFIAQQVQESAPKVTDLLGSMLDQNKDGSSMDDLQRMAARIFN